MAGQAPRRADNLLQRCARGAVLTAAFVAAALGAAAQADTPRTERDGVTARFEEPTHRYGHAIVGGLPEWGALCLDHDARSICVHLPSTSVFEDIAPRLHDLDGDGTPEAVVVESSFAGGAALVVYQLDDDTLKRIATPPIGTRNRWLAPAGIADLDGDGRIELSYVDRPHLAKRLRIWRFENGALSHVADADRLTNHRIGEPFITGGLRDCGSGPEIITANANWSRVMSSRLESGRILSDDLGPFSPSKIAAALKCR